MFTTGAKARQGIPRGCDQLPPQLLPLVCARACDLPPATANTIPTSRLDHDLKRALRALRPARVPSSPRNGQRALIAEPGTVPHLPCPPARPAVAHSTAQSHLSATPASGQAAPADPLARHPTRVLPTAPTDASTRRTATHCQSRSTAAACANKETRPVCARRRRVLRSYAGASWLAPLSQDFRILSPALSSIASAEISTSRRVEAAQASPCAAPVVTSFALRLPVGSVNSRDLRSSRPRTRSFHPPPGGRWLHEERRCARGPVPEGRSYPGDMSGKCLVCRLSLRWSRVAPPFALRSSSGIVMPLQSAA